MDCAVGEQLQVGIGLVDYPEHLPQIAKHQIRSVKSDRSVRIRGQSHLSPRRNNHEADMYI
jgi:hypothetical protein